MRSPLLPLLLVLAGCNSPTAHTTFPDAGQVLFDEKLPPYAGELPASCELTSGSTHFVDTTVAWGLGTPGLAVVGNRLTAADLDGDGYPDLVVHAVSSNRRQSLDGGAHLVWQLMNRPSPDGHGRVFVDATGNGLFALPSGDGTQYRSAQLAVFADVDNDGDLDAFSGTYADPTNLGTDPGDRSQIALNDGTGHFTYAPASAPTPGPTQHFPTTSATFADFDRDGRVDLFVAYWYAYYGRTYSGIQAQLFHGAGDGTFTDLTQASGLTTTVNGFAAGTNHRPAYGVTSCDLNGDGAPELLVSAYGRQWNLLYQNDGQGHFTEVGQASTYAGDGNLDFHDNEFFKCWCVDNATSPKCAGVATPLVQCPTPAGANWSDGVDDQPWRQNGNTFTTVCGDVDGDGLNDLFSAEIHHWWAGQSGDSSELLHNVSADGGVLFARPGNAATGLSLPRVGTSWNEGAMMVAGADLDDDGRLDLVVAESDYPDQHLAVFHQKPDGTFEDLAVAWGLPHVCPSGLVVADFDRDGDLDVLVGSSTARDCSATWSKNELHLYENQGGGGQGLSLRLRGDGVTANRSAIGARVTVKAGGRTQTREVGGGYGHFGMQHGLDLNVGLGACPAAAEVTVRWPDAAGTTQTFARVPAGQLVELRMNEADLYKVPGGP